MLILRQIGFWQKTTNTFKSENWQNFGIRQTGKFRNTRTPSFQKTGGPENLNARTADI